MQVITYGDIDFVNRFGHGMPEEGSEFTLDEIVSVKFCFCYSLGEYVPYLNSVPRETQVLNPSGPTDCVLQVPTPYRYQQSRNVVPLGRQ